jgi:hypothetical protein
MENTIEATILIVEDDEEVTDLVCHIADDRM